ncbi:MAG: hypothetical protein N2Z80_01665 [Hydrogenothermaceae bacterium]|nr:hypothetical protein [Hydrogenothermaceae bacterium]
MENMYEPYEILLSEDGEIVALVEPDEKTEEVVESNTSPETTVDVSYDEEEGELFLTLSLIFDDVEIFLGLPYGETWDSLIEKEAITLAFVSKVDFESEKIEDIPVLEIELDELTVGFIEGANRVAQVLLGEKEEE